MSRVESLYTESGEHALATLWQIYVIIGQSWALSRDIPPTEQYISPLSKESLRSIWRQAILQELDSLPDHPFQDLLYSTLGHSCPYCNTCLCDLPKACTPPDTFHKLCT
jgi:hypothetical protein